MKVLIAAGGTGGHLYPGIALAQELKKRDCEIRFVIRKGNKGEIITNYGWEYYTLDVSGFPRRISKELVSFFIKLVQSLISAIKIIRYFSPDVIVGMGGYVSFPVALVAKVLGYHVIIHEQNSYPGLANRILNIFVDKVAIGFPGTEKYFSKENVVHTGNPVREEIGKTNREVALEKFGLDKNKFTLLVFGGSAGAHRINEVVTEMLAKISDYKDRIQFIHISGTNDFDWVKKKYTESGFQFIVYPYYEQMSYVYAAADLVISRSGASTVSELDYLQKKSILIPYPYATNNHQFYNAQYLTGLGLAQIVLDKELNSDKLAILIKESLIDKKTKGEISAKTNLSAAVKLADLVFSVIEL